MQSAAKLDVIFRALAHPVRRCLLHVLVRGKAFSARELASQLHGGPRALSRHLKTLEKAGLIQRIAGGGESRFQLREEALQTATAWLVRHDTRRVQALDELDRRLSWAARNDQQPELLGEPLYLLDR